MDRVMALRGAPPMGAESRAASVAPHQPEQPIVLEARPLAACGEIAGAWAHLAGRALEPNPFYEPGFLLAAAQHLVAFREVMVLLAWQGAEDGPQRRLLGFVPVFPRNGFFLPDALIGLSDRRVAHGAPLLDRQSAGAVIEALVAPRRQRLLDGRGLVLRAIERDGPLAATLRELAETGRLGVSSLPAAPPAPALPRSAASLAAPKGAGGLKLVEPRSQAALRDAVEIILAMEASGPRGRSGAATLHDTREVGFLRAMTRSLARGRQCRVGLLMQEETPVAGAIVIGRGARSWLYLGVEDEAMAGREPLRDLLAAMRRAMPARRILLPAGLPADEDGLPLLGDVALSVSSAAAPRDLAGRARDAIRRSLTRLPLMGRSGVKPPRAGAA
ncbi:GNAT family N-acetyltransferase [Bosea sp. (in: a-proteobacteria)]|uniref:GNAT family N-acetyltransferase n=1 Tax=Bosea sp. (in: a-proteobacteria) TaxID=1871050 RepID=UPI002B48F147|nr:GNAT family N-acetyltransferase [Bosea sp. (in: a-proteobacteria)]WRH56299.1 MAG: GNAT family N-acetyltransferase [Bosea sp. (in: a-proteobacteria)]